ncbi:cell division ATP-binding protein FtsE [Agilicoccus flavus]|uniref:cell division ATP-binding protein FtsE n=1 Tax=Agilicoccus flavus TaxID=2775968 RepID=UPI001CF6FA88|nr:cell division ATP-binding protein FtsE [Agilicoccus flavus]
MIRFENVVMSYGRRNRPALDDVDLHVADGEFVFLVGMSGSGKSTIMRLLLREDRASAGKIFVGSREVTKIRRRDVPRLRRDIGMVFQDFRLLADRTVSGNVAYVLDVLGAPRADVRRRVPEALERVGLAGMERRLPHELSGGEQQRVAIARAIVKRPRLLLADEPTGNLDPVTSIDITKVLRRIHAEGTTVLMATHDDQIVDDVRARVVELHEGRVVRDEAGGGYGRPRAVWHEPRTGSTAADRPDPAPTPTATTHEEGAR